MRSAHVANGPGVFGERVEIGPHAYTLDEPKAEGGDDVGPTAREALLGALGACTAATLRMYARRKGWPLASVDVVLELKETPGERAVIVKKVKMEGELTDEQRTRLQVVADRCPVHKLISGGVTIGTSFE